MGNGRNSGLPKGLKNIDKSRLTDYTIKNKDLAKHYSKLGIEIHDSVFKEVPKIFLVDAHNAILNMQYTYRLDPSEMHEIEMELGRKSIKHESSYASMNFSGHLKVYQLLRDKYANMLSGYSSDLREGFHPAGTVLADTVSHEYAHAIEAQLIRRIVPETVYSSGYKSDVDRLIAWNDHIVANTVVNQAKANLKLSDSDFNSEVKKLTGYGYDYMTEHKGSHAETFAEALAAYARTGKKSGKLATEVAKITKGLLNKK